MVLPTLGTLAILIGMSKRAEKKETILTVPEAVDKMKRLEKTGSGNSAQNKAWRLCFCFVSRFCDKRGEPSGTPHRLFKIEKESLADGSITLDSLEI